MTKVTDIRAAGDLVIEKRELTEPLAAQEGLSGQLSRFPEEVYNLTIDSHLYRLISALAGEVGAGSLKKELLLPKLQQMLDSTHFKDLDLLYGNPMGLPRLNLESYSFDPQGTPLTQGQWNEVRAKDADYRSRCLKWMRAILHGATLEGISLAAEAALNVECDVYERYRHLENLNSDNPQNLVASYSFEDNAEFATPILARSDTPPLYAWDYTLTGVAAIPTIISGVGINGSRFVSATSTAAAADSVEIHSYAKLRINADYAYTYTAFFRRASGTGDPKATLSVACYDEANSLLGTVFPATPVAGVNPLVSNNINPNGGVASATWEHWGGSILASAWPAGTLKVVLKVTVYGTNSVSGQMLVDAIQFEQGTDATLFGSRTPGTTNAHTEVVIVPQLPDIQPEERRRVMRLVDRLRPVDTVITLTSGNYVRVERPAIRSAASSSAWNIQRLVTARSDRTWPDRNVSEGFWLVAGVETEAPTFAWIDRQESATFLSIQSVTASSTKVGNFNTSQRQLFPQLAAVTDPFDTHLADRSFAKSFAKLNFTIPWVNRT